MVVNQGERSIRNSLGIMKLITPILIAGLILGAVDCFAKDEMKNNPFSEVLRVVPPPELPTQAAALVRSARKGDRETINLRMVQNKGAAQQIRREKHLQPWLVRRTPAADPRADSCTCSCSSTPGHYQETGVRAPARGPMHFANKRSPSSRMNFVDSRLMHEI